MITVDARFLEVVDPVERSLRAGRVDRFTLCILRDRDIEVDQTSCEGATRVRDNIDELPWNS